MEKAAKDLKAGEKIQPWISERTMKRKKTQFTVTGEPEKLTGAWEHMVEIPCTDSKGNPDNILYIAHENIFVVD